MPDCPSIDPLLTPYVDGELPGVEREAVAQHLHACSPCRARVAVEQAVRDLVRARRSALQRDRASDALRTTCAMLGSAGGSRRSSGSKGSERTTGTFRTPRTSGAAWLTRTA